MQQPFHVFHKVPSGDGPYVKAKHVQLVEKNPDRAIQLFRLAIHAGDRVDSALKDMAIVLKQQNQPEEAIQAIANLRHRCSEHAQDSLDNVLLDLYKSCGKLDEQIALLTQKLNLFHQGSAFNGRRTKTARSQGKKFQVSLEQETTRLLGNLGWAFMQKSNFIAAEAVYRRALSMEIDNNKLCNLGICLMKQGMLEEARVVLRKVSRPVVVTDKKSNSESHMKSYDRAQQLLKTLQISIVQLPANRTEFNSLEEGEELSWQPPCLASNSQSSNCSQTQQHGHAQEGSNHCKIERKAAESEMNGMVAAVAAAADAWVLNAAWSGQEEETETEEDENDHAKKSFMESSISQMQQRRSDLPGIFSNPRRRLPVFQDLTILGNA